MAYINKELVEKIKHVCISKYPLSYIDGILAFAREIAEMPVADIEEVKHGEWIVDKVHSVRLVHSPNLTKRMCYKCSLCGRKSGNNRHLNYCPRCGAKMDGGV